MRKKKGKINQQKSFFFQDYDESEIITNNKNIIYPKISSNRITFLFFVFFSFVLIISIKTIYLSLSPEKIVYSKKNNQYFVKESFLISISNHLIHISY